MTDSGRQSGHSPPSSMQLPSFSSISGTIGYQVTPQRARRESLQESSIDIIQTMRQQIGVRDQSIAMLRSEQDRNLSRYEALETKSQVMDHEVAVLMEEKADLRRTVNNLTTQVEKLNHEKEELRGQSKADAAQWRQIMSMSSRLQTQSIEESRRYNAEREAWSRERERLEHKLSELSDKVIGQSDSGDGVTGTSHLYKVLTVSSMSEDQLRQEVIDLRQRCRELEYTLSALIQESAGIERAGILIKEARRRMILAQDRGEIGSLVTNQD